MLLYCHYNNYAYIRMHEVELVHISVRPRKGAFMNERSRNIWSSYFLVALWNRETIYIFMLWFVLLLFSSPNLSRRRLDVCHTSTHGVALVRI